MKNNKLQEKINQMYDIAVDQYESDDDHDLSQVEKLIWKKDIFSLPEFSETENILDVGTGTGVLARYLADLGYTVTGFEPVQEMLNQAQKLSGNNESVQYILGDTHTLGTFAPSSFDCIVSRQVVCHFYDPIAAFSNWFHWLKNKGMVVITDGLWFREDWNNDDLIDRLPLSCLQTRATLTYMLEKAGFKVLKNDFMDSLNQREDEVKKPTPSRYVIIAQKP